MKTLILIFLLMGNICAAEAQAVKDPLLNYYQMITKPRFFHQNSDPAFSYSPKTQLICFEANFTESKRKSFFITDGGQKLGPHGKYAWTIYVPLGSGDYRIVRNASDEIHSGVNGPAYIGYIGQLKRYGIVEGDRDSVTAYYVDDVGIQSQDIDDKRGHANKAYYPQYFGHNAEDRQITTYTLGQLAQKYAQ